MVTLKPIYQSEPTTGYDLAAQPAKEQLLTKETVRLPMGILSTFRFSEIVVKGAADLKYTGYYLGKIKALAGLKIVLTVSDLGAQIAEFPKDTTPDKIEGVANIIERAGTAADATTTFVFFLEAIEAVGKVGRWTRGVEVFYIFTESVSIALSIKKLVETHGLSNKLELVVKKDDSEEQFTLEDYRKGMKLILDKRQTSKNFIKEGLHSDEPMIAHRLMTIEANAEKKLKSYDKAQVAEGRRTLKTTMESIKARINSKKWSHRLDILISAVTIIGCVILFCSPISPIGWALLAVATIVCLTNTYYHKKRIEEQFRKSLFSPIS